MSKAFACGLILGLFIGYAYWIIGRWLHEKDLAARAASGHPTFLNDRFYYLIPETVYLAKELFKLVPATVCEHGYTDTWSDDCPDCRH